MTETRANAQAPEPLQAPSARPSARSLAWHSVPLAATIATYGLTTAGLATTLSLFLANAVRADPFGIGLFFTARAAAAIVLGVAIGWLSDQMRDRRGIIGAASLGGAAGALSLALSRDYTVALVTGAVFGSIGQAGFGQLFAYANEFATARGRDVTAFSAIMRSLFSAAYVIGPPLALALMVRYGFGPLYLGVTGCTLAAALIGRWGLRRVAPVTVPSPRPRRADGDHGVRRRFRGGRLLAGAALPARTWLLLGVVLVLGTVIQMYGIDIPLHVTKDLGLSPELVGWMLGLTAGLEIPVMIVAGRLARRLGSGRLVGVSAVVATVSYCLVPLVHSAAALLAIAGLFGVWQGVALSIPMVMVQDESPGGMGTASSLYGAAFGAAGLIAGAATGVTASAVGYGNVLWVCAALSVLAAAGMLARYVLSPGGRSPAAGARWYGCRRWRAR